MNLAQALRLSRSSRAALVGAGGKTTALFQAARSLEKPVVVTSSTHLGVWQAVLADRHIIVTRPGDVARESGQIEDVTLLSGPEGKDQRLGGLDEVILDELAELADRLQFPVLIEADGSRQKPLKAPEAHEPVIPSWVDVVVVVAGLSGLGKILDEDTVHRPAVFAALSGRAVGERIEEDDLARVLAHHRGGLKSILPDVRKVVLLNQVEDDLSFAAAWRIAKKLIPPYDSVLITALREQKIHRVIEPCAGIILAGGGSYRFGRPKILLEWRGKPLVRHVAETALASGLDPVIVITGSVDEPIHQALDALNVTFVHNPSWQDGQSTSVGQGVRALPPGIGSAVFFLADQPYVSAEVVRALVTRHEETLAPIVAPRVGERRTNPVLLDCGSFGELTTLRGDKGGRGIMERHAVTYVDWDDENLLFDIDTPDDYSRLLRDGN